MTLESAALARRTPLTDMSVEAVPAGFKVVRMAYGETFFCKSCDRRAVTNYAGQSSSMRD
jgi:hypothetical protein